MKFTPFLILALAAGLAGPVLAQDQSAEEAARQHAIVGGRDVQPRPAPGEAGKTDPEVQRLLDQGKDTGPVVPPHDIYGNPIGGNPGLNPPPPAPLPPPPPAPKTDRPPGSR